MTPTAPILQRLNTHRTSIRKMLNPGLKSSDTGPRPLSPVLEGLGSKKYTQIVQKIRFLAAERLGKFAPQSIALTGRALSEKFANPASLLHVRPSAASGSSIWSEIEQVLPVSETAAGNQGPVEAGVLRAGSPIQRMPPISKPGQAIPPASPKARPPAPPKPARKIQQPADPSMRRYSRVEEITKQETPSEEVSPAPVTQRQPDLEPDIQENETQVPSEQTPPPEPTPTRQQAPARTPEPPAPASKPEPLPKQKPVSAVEKKATQPGQSPRSESEPDRPDKEVAPTTSKRTPAQAIEKPSKESSSARQPAKNQLARALPAPRKPAPGLPPAQPELKKAQPSQLQAARPRPTATPSGLLQKKTIASPVTQTTSNLIQRKVERSSPVAPPPPRQHKPDQPAPTAPIQQDMPDASIQTSPPEKSAPHPIQDTPIAQPVAHTFESPLLEHLFRRRAEQVRILKPQIAHKETSSPPTILRQNLIGPRRAEKLIPPSTPSTETVTLNVPDEAATISRQPERTTQPASRPKMDMPVVRSQPGTSDTARRPQPSSAPGGAQILTPFPSAPATQARAGTPPWQKPVSDLPQLEESFQPSTAQSTSGDVIQRMWEEHQPAQSDSGGNTGGSASQESSEQTGLNLEKLAEDVLPIVKRLLEIESERSSGYIR